MEDLFKTKLSKTKDGKLFSEAIYPEKPIVLKTTKGEKTVGTQPEHTIINVIDDVKTLRNYLQEQYDAVKDRYNKGMDVLKNLENINEEKLKVIVEKIPSGTFKGKKLKNIDDLAGRVLMKIDTQTKMITLKHNLDKIGEQLSFIDKNF